MSANNHYDIIIIGTDAGGGTLAYRLAQSGKKILLLERGPFLPREKDNWNTKVVFNSDRYHNTHDIDNLYVVDGSFFCSSGAVNPTLTIIANALRVGEHLVERMK